MATNRYRLSELGQLPTEALRAQVRSIASLRSQPLNGELVALTEQISAFEQRYEMSSEAMERQFRAGEIKETADIGKWMMLLNVRKRAKC